MHSRLLISCSVTHLTRQPRPPITQAPLLTLPRPPAAFLSLTPPPEKNMPFLDYTSTPTNTIHETQPRNSQHSQLQLPTQDPYALHTVPTSLRGPGHAGSSIGSAPPSPSGFLRQNVQRCRSVTGSVRRRSTSPSFSRWMSACVVSADGRAAPAAVAPPPAPAAVGGGAPGAGVDGAVAAAVPDADFLVEPPLPALLLDLALVADCCSW